MRNLSIIACLTLASLFTQLEVKANDVQAERWVDAYNNALIWTKSAGAAAVNFLVVQNSATAVNPTIVAEGADANLGIDLKAKGTGAVRILDGNGNVVLQPAAAVASAVNGIVFTNAVTSANPSIAPGGTGSDTNDSIILKGKGTGVPILQDGSGASELTFVKTATAVDNVQITNGATGSPGVVKVSGVGTDAAITLTLEGKGTGAINVGQATASGIVNVGDAPIQDSAGKNEISFIKTATAVDNIQITNAATASPALVDIAGVGTDTNVSIKLTPKGTGSVQSQLGGSTSYAGVVVQANRQFSIAGVACSAGSTDDTLFTYTLPANALKNTGDYVRVYGFGTPGGATASTFKLWFGGTAIMTDGGVSVAGNVTQQATVMKTGAGTQLVFSERNVHGTTLNVACAAPAALAITDTAPIIIKFTANSGAATATGSGFIVECGHQ